MDIVWERSKQKGASLLVLLAIADHAHDDGGGAYPATATLAHKTRLTIRGVQRIIRELVRSSELTVHLNAGPNRVNLYHVNIVTMKNIHPDFGDTTTPDRNDGGGVTLHEQETVIEPSIEPSNNIWPEWVKILEDIQGYRGQLKRLKDLVDWVNEANIPLELVRKGLLDLKAEQPHRNYKDVIRAARNWISNAQRWEGTGRPARTVPSTNPEDFETF